jgi:small subunit ribosomal protein S24e
LKLSILKGKIMKFEIVQKTENPLLKRTELKFKILHEKASTPKRAEVRSQIASVLNVPEELVIIEKIASLHGRQEASGIARVYDSRERLEALEPRYLLRREVPKEEEKPPEKIRVKLVEKPEEKPEAKPEEKPAPEEKPEEPEKPPEEKPPPPPEEKPTPKQEEETEKPPEQESRESAEEKSADEKSKGNPV